MRAPAMPFLWLPEPAAEEPQQDETAAAASQDDAATALIADASSGDDNAADGAVAPIARLVHGSSSFSHDDAKAISKQALKRETAALVVVDLHGAENATTAAFATLVLLRRELLRNGRDLRLAGLRSRTRHMYDVSRLDGVLPKHRGD